MIVLSLYMGTPHSRMESGDQNVTDVRETVAGTNDTDPSVILRESGTGGLFLAGKNATEEDGGSGGPL